MSFVLYSFIYLTITLVGEWFQTKNAKTYSLHNAKHKSMQKTFEIVVAQGLKCEYTNFPVQIMEIKLPTINLANSL